MSPIFKRPSLVPTPEIPELGQIPGRQTSAEIAEASRDEKRRRLAARGRSSTILGGGSGVPGAIGQKTLLGS